MKLITLSISVLLLMISLMSCGDSSCEQTVTYTKAIGIYSDLEELRLDGINSPARELINPGKIYVSEELLLIAEKGEGIHVIDNSDPSIPQFINFLTVPGNVEMAISGTTIYLDSYYDMLEIDISNPNQAIITSILEEAFEVRYRDQEGRALIGFNKEVVTETVPCNSNLFDNDILWFDFEDIAIPESALPTSFVSSGSNFGTVNRMAIVNDWLYVLGGSEVSILSITNDNLELRNRVGFGWNMETIYPFDNHLFIGSQNSMIIANITDPMNPVWEGEFWHATSCDPVLPTDQGIAYVTLRGGNECPGDENTLNTLNISNTANPTLLSSIDLDSPYAMAIHQGLLYVGEGENGFRNYQINGNALSEQIYRSDITAYDIIPHPTDQDVLLFAGPDGISQYQLADQDLTLLSQISY